MSTKQWILAFTFSLSAGGTADAQPATKANLDYIFSRSIASRIEELGSSSYAKREAAYKRIESFGPMALDQLRRYRGVGNTEARRRVEELIRRAEDQQIAQQILAPKEVQLNLKTATVQEAIVELARKSGYLTQFQGDATRFADKKVTLEGKMSYWEALDKLCEQAGLMERIHVANSFDPYTRVGSPYGSARPQGPLVLVNRSTERSIVSHAGAVKTELRLSRDKESNEVTVLLMISAEPRLLQCTLVGDAVIGQCTNEKGKSVPVLHGVKKTKANSGDEAFRMAELERIAAFGAADPSATFRRVAQIRLNGNDAAKQIKELSGKLTMQVELQNETLARVDKIMESAGKSVDGPNGGKLTIQSIKKLPNDKYEVNVRIEDLGENPFKDKVAFNGNGGIAIRGNIAINGGGMVIGPNGVRISSSGNGKGLPDLLDAKGQKLKNTGALHDNFNLANNSCTRTARIVYQADAGQADPIELVLFGTRTHTIAVPFRFENLLLP